MAKRGIIGTTADAVKSVAGIALGAAAAAATTAVIELMAKSLTKGEDSLEKTLPAIENAVKARVSKPAQNIADRLLTQAPRTKARKTKVKKARAAKKAARKVAAKKKTTKKKTAKKTQTRKAPAKKTAKRPVKRSGKARR